MKRLFSILFILLLFPMTLFPGDEENGPDYPCSNKNLQTPEPGTCLSLNAYRLLQAIEHVEKNPYNNDIAKKLIDFVEPRVYKTVHSIIPGDTYDVPIKIYYPTRKSTQRPTQIVLFIHGGGFMFGSIEEYDMAVKKFARKANKIVVALDYRLAPEHPYPAAVDDSNLVLHWLSDHAEQLGGTGSRIFLMGDSAGGNIAAVLALKDRDEESNRVCGQILLYPATTMVEKEFPSRVYFLNDESKNYMLTKDFLYISKKSYLQEGMDESDPYVSPLEADLSIPLAPTLIVNAEVDPLRDDGRFFAEKLGMNGQVVVYKEYEGIIHGFFNFYMVLPEARKAMILIGKFIDDHSCEAPPKFTV